MKTEESPEVVERDQSERELPDVTSDEQSMKNPATPVSRPSKAVLSVLLLIAAITSVLWYLHVQTYEITDDAQIDGHINSVSSQIAGIVARVYVDDNQAVQADQPLVELDTRELAIAEEQTKAQYAQAVANLDSEDPNVAITRNSTQADITVAESQLMDARAALDASRHDHDNASSRLEEARATATRDQLQADRYKQLYDRDEASREEFESYSATALASDAHLAAAKAALASAAQTVKQRQAQVDAQVAHLGEVSRNAPQQVAVQVASVESEHAGVDLARAERDRAKLSLSYAHITAPISGVVTQKSVEKGNRIGRGEQLLMIVDISHLWVTANFKETQLRRMHPGCRATIHIDATGKDLKGSVESMPAITGSRASVLPPENATGNYVKVVQRLPVRIRLVSGQAGLKELRPGMSVEAKVYLR